MDKFTTLTGVAAPLPIDNIDTDMIIPKQYLKTIKRTGLGAGLFAEMRYRDNGSEMDDAERGANATLTVDLMAQEIRGPDGGVVGFEIDAFRKQRLMEGLDDIGLTMVEAPAIAAQEKKSAAARPWL
jgi:3-isopropylmalate dehydratase small subunit